MRPLIYLENIFQALTLSTATERTFNERLLVLLGFVKVRISLRYVTFVLSFHLGRTNRTATLHDEFSRSNLSHADRYEHVLTHIDEKSTEYLRSKCLVGLIRIQCSIHFLFVSLHRDDQDQCSSELKQKLIQAFKR